MMKKALVALASLGTLAAMLQSAPAHASFRVNDPYMPPPIACTAALDGQEVGTWSRNRTSSYSTWVCDGYTPIWQLLQVCVEGRYPDECEEF